MIAVLFVIAAVLLVTALGLLIAAPIAYSVTRADVWGGIMVSAFIAAVVALIVCCWAGPQL
jgi:hypothetical protein